MKNILIKVLMSEEDINNLNFVREKHGLPDVSKTIRLLIDKESKNIIRNIKYAKPYGVRAIRKPLI